MSKPRERAAQPGAGDDIPPDMCRRCGMTGVHADATACIDGLRDRVAVLQFRLGAAMARRDTHGGRPPLPKELAG